MADDRRFFSKSFWRMEKIPPALWQLIPFEAFQHVGYAL